MIEITKAQKNSKRKMWCNVCGAEDSMGIRFSPNESEYQGNMIFLCKDCMKDLVNKVNTYLESEE